MCAILETMESTQLPNVWDRKQAVLNLFLGILWLLGLVLSLAVDRRYSPLSDRLQALWTVGAVLNLAIGIRLRRSGITLDDEGITARGRLWTKRLRWNDIESFDLGPSLGLRLLAVHPNGRRVRLQSYRGMDESDAQSALYVLNSELQRRRMAP
jgi:hypothetical protein